MASQALSCTAVKKSKAVSGTTRVFGSKASQALSLTPPIDPPTAAHVLATAHQTADRLRQQLHAAAASSWQQGSSSGQELRRKQPKKGEPANEVEDDSFTKSWNAMVIKTYCILHKEQQDSLNVCLGDEHRTKQEDQDDPVDCFIGEVDENDL